MKALTIQKFELCNDERPKLMDKHHCEILGDRKNLKKMTELALVVQKTFLRLMMDSLDGENSG